MTMEVITYALAGTLSTELDASTVEAMLGTGITREAGIQFPESCETEVEDIVVDGDSVTMTVTTPLRHETVRRIVEESLTKEAAMKHPGASCTLTITSIEIQ